VDYRPPQPAVVYAPAPRRDLDDRDYDDDGGKAHHDNGRHRGQERREREDSRER
jgi:hypothetical protein